MDARVRQLFEEARKLSASERQELAHLLAATIDTDAEIEAIWAREVADRLTAVQSGHMTTRPATDVLAKYRDL